MAGGRTPRPRRLPPRPPDAVVSIGRPAVADQAGPYAASPPVATVPNMCSIRSWFSQRRPDERLFRRTASLAPRGDVRGRLRGSRTTLCTDLCTDWGRIRWEGGGLGGPSVDRMGTTPDSGSSDLIRTAGAVVDRFLARHAVAPPSACRGGLHRTLTGCHSALPRARAVSAPRSGSPRRGRRLGAAAEVNGAGIELRRARVDRVTLCGRR